jgi:quinol monooxygenase YgiN
MSVLVLATVKPYPQHRSEVTAALASLVSSAHAERGVELFALLEGEHDLIILQKWTDQAAIDAHIAAPLSVELRHRLASKLQEVPTHTYLTPIPVGNGPLGSI